MECFPKEYSGLREIATVNALECMSDMSFRGRLNKIPCDPCPEKIIHPKPRRSSPLSHPFVVDDRGRCKLQRHHFRSRNLTEQKYDACSEIIDIIMTKGATDEEGSSLSSYFRGSPPARTSNPVVHDTQFTRQALVYESPCGSSLAVRSSSRVESRSPSCGASFGGKPMVRIEGFAASDSKSNCIVPAFA